MQRDGRIFIDGVMLPVRAAKEADFNRSSLAMTDGAKCRLGIFRACVSSQGTALSNLRAIVQQSDSKLCLEELCFKKCSRNHVECSNGAMDILLWVRQR